MRSALLFFVLVASRAVHAQTMRVHDSETMTLKGIITVQAAMRSQQITLRLRHPVIPVVQDADAEHDGEPTWEVQLYVDYEDFSRLGGRTVVVSGTMQTDDASGYFFNGTRFKPASIFDEHGHKLMPKVRAPSLTRITGQSYRATATLWPDPATPWRYRAIGNGRALAHAGNFSCSGNAPGDVVNCFCSKDFIATHPVARIDGKYSAGQTFAGMSFAQFGGVADEESRRQPKVTIQVVCVRDKVHNAAN